MGIEAAWAMVSPPVVNSADDASIPSLTMLKYALLSRAISISSAITSNLCRSTSSVMRSMPIHLSLCLLPTLKNGCHTLATADTHRFQAVARVAPLHFMQQGRENAGPGGRNGMAQRK